MKTYTTHGLHFYTVYVDDETGKVHHAVNFNCSNPTTLYPYEPAKGGGLDNACGLYTLRQVRNRFQRGDIVFK